MVLYHSEAVRNPAGIIVWYHSMNIIIRSSMIGREVAKAWAKYT